MGLILYLAEEVVDTELHSTFFLSAPFIELGAQLLPFYLFSQGQHMMGKWPDARHR